MAIWVAEFSIPLRSAFENRTAVSETFYFDENVDGISDPHVNQIDWTYDNAGRLVDEVFNHYDDTLDQTEHFTLDLTGNRLQRTVDEAGVGQAPRA